MVEYEDEALAARIKKAFADVPHPDDDRLVDDPRHWEGGQFAREFAGKDWKTLPLEFLSDNLFSLHYFTPEAFRYYLPAYLLAALRKLSDAEAQTGAGNIEHTVSCCLHPDWCVAGWMTQEQTDVARGKFRARVSGLTLAQKVVVRDYVRWWDQHFGRSNWQKADALAAGFAEEWRFAEESRECWENIAPTI
jgi:hypothetical protein